MLYAKNKSRVAHLEQRGVLDPKGSEMVGGDCMIYCCLTGCAELGWVMQIGERANVRMRYRMEGTSVMD
ncbi:hypothetical protein FRB98_002344, partial [Tulasnella sp. 332]